VDGGLTRFAATGRWLRARFPTVDSDYNVEARPFAPSVSDCSDSGGTYGAQSDDSLSK